MPPPDSPAPALPTDARQKLRDADLTEILRCIESPESTGVTIVECAQSASLKRVSFGVTLWIVLTFLAMLPVGLSLLGLLTMGG